MSTLFRKLHFGFWDDEYILEELDKSDEVWLYAALILNSKTTACGIYEVTMGFLAQKTKIPKDEVQTIINRFEQDNKILYCKETKEVFVRKTMKYHLKQLNNPKFLGQLKNELMLVKHIPFIHAWFEQLRGFGVDISLPTVEGGFIIDDVLVGRDETGAPTAPRNKGKGKKKEKPTNPDIRVAIDHYFKVFEEIFNTKPKLGKADPNAVVKALKTMTIDEVKNRIDYCLDVWLRPKSKGGEGLNGSLKTCFLPFFLTEYEKKWQTRKFDYGDKDKPVTHERWWNA